MYEGVVPPLGFPFVFHPEACLEPLEFQLKPEYDIQHKLGEFGQPPDLFDLFYPPFNTPGVYARDEFFVHCLMFSIGLTSR